MADIRLSSAHGAFSHIPVLLATFSARIRGTVRRKGKFDGANPRDLSSQNSTLPENVAALSKRPASYHRNQLEMLCPYATGIATCVAAIVADTGLDVLSALYIAFRALYIVAYAAPQICGAA